MKFGLVPLLGISTALLAVATLQFAHKASMEHQRAERAVALSAKQVTLIQGLEKALGASQSQLTDAQGAPPQSKATSSSTFSSRQPGDSKSPALLAVRPPNPELEDRAIRTVPPRPAPSPAAQRFQQWQKQEALRKEFQDVGVSVGLTDSETRHLLDLIGKHGPMPQADGTVSYGKDVDEFLGPNRKALFDDYIRTQPERMQASAINDRLRQMGTPMTEDQRTQLVSLLIQDADRPYVPSPGIVETNAQASITDQVNWLKEKQRRTLERSKSVLNADQYQRLSDYMVWQAEMMDNSYRAMSDQVARDRNNQK